MNMKNIVSKTVLLALVITLGSCSEDLYDEKFADPGKSATVDFANLMVGTNLYAREWAMSGYGRFFGWESQVLMKQANTVGLTLDVTAFYSLEGYTDGMPPLGEFSKMVASYKFMESLYTDMDDAAKAVNKVCLLAAETQLYQGLAYMLSIFGDIPFDEVGQVSVTGDVSLAHPHYQTDEELYSKILDRLGELNTEWATITDANVPGTFKAQDFINKGDIDKWRRYNNSIRLKTALLVSTQGALATKGQQVLAEILGNSGGHPIIDAPEYNVVMAQVDKSGSTLDINGGSGFDWVNQRMAGAEIIKRMQVAGDGGTWSGVGTLFDGTSINTATTDDPRLPIMFCLATVNGEFAVLTEQDLNNAEFVKTNGKAFPSVYRGSCAATDPDEWAEFLYPSDSRAYYSYIRPNGFFKDNRNWDNPIITSAEVNFIKAEVFQRGWANGDAKAAFKNGVKESIALYFKYQNNRSHKEDALTPGASATSRSFKAVINPDEETYNEAWINTFAENRWTTRVDGTSYSNLEAILEQKWLHYGYMYANEQWSDLRRTGYPSMTYYRDTGFPDEDAPWPIHKSKYPESERNNNANFQDEIQSKGKDDWYYKLFWAKENWYTQAIW
jgi:hypothetical protein